MNAAAAVAHYREVAYQAVMARVLADPTHPQHQQLHDVLEAAMELDSPYGLTAGGYAGGRGDSSGEARPEAPRPSDLSHTNILHGVDDCPVRSIVRPIRPRPWVVPS